MKKPLFHQQILLRPGDTDWITDRNGEIRKADIYIENDNAAVEGALSQFNSIWDSACVWDDRNLGMVLDASVHDMFRFAAIREVCCGQFVEVIDPIGRTVIGQVLGVTAYNPYCPREAEDIIHINPGGYVPPTGEGMPTVRELFARADIRVCSPYQIFRSFFGFKGYEASLCSFLSAQLIFDEIHAYDTQITAMILASTKFLCERLSARVLFMSATMPTHLLESIKNLFPGLPEPIRPSQKMLSQSVRHKVHLLPCHVFSSVAIENIVAAAEKGSVLVVVNRVARSVELAKMLRLHGIEDIILLHSRFCPRDRSAKEKQLAPKKGRILVATQVVEVSLDIDYDTGFFELAPLESLLQRFGRVNRYGYRPPSSVYVFEVFDQELNKAAKPYIPIHLSCVLNVLQEFIKDNETCVWSELDTQRLLDIPYPLELKEELLKEIQERVEEYDKYFVRELRPFGAKNIETMKSLQENWDKLFDGYEVLPEELFGVAMNCKNSLSVAQLLVPILSRQFMRLLHDGRLFWNKDINEYVAQCEYDSEYGMNFKC